MGKDVVDDLKDAARNVMESYDITGCEGCGVVDHSVMVTLVEALIGINEVKPTDPTVQAILDPDYENDDEEK